MPTPRLLLRLGVAMLLVCARALPQDAPAGTLRSYLQGIALRQLAARKGLISEVHTPEQFEKRKAEVRHLFLTLMGGLPDERAALNIQKRGTIDRGDYRIEKIIYQSLPHFYVTANLYVPQAEKPPFPAVLQLTGHSLAAKARASYQTLALGLVKNGFVVLTYDPLGQGERRVYYDATLGDSKVGGTTMEHDMVGIQSLLAGQSIARYMIWDGMRGIDLLQSLSYVDPKRVGISGCSGGGTNRLFGCAGRSAPGCRPVLLYH
jgi:acetyl xylan esterase AXE1